MLLATRAAVVVPFALVHNAMPHAERLKRRDVVVIWWSGLMRGAVSVALVYLHFDRQEQVRARAAVASCSGSFCSPSSSATGWLQLRAWLHLVWACAGRPLCKQPEGKARACCLQTADRHRATLIVSTLCVVLASIMAVGALTKPLLGNMLRDGDDAALAARLDHVPLLG